MKKSMLFVIIFLVSFLFFMLMFNIMDPNRELLKMLTGGVTSIGTISFFVEGHYQTRNMTLGWNFVSFNVETNNYSVESMLSSIDGYYDYVMEWDTDNQEFKTWSRFGSKEFTEMNKNKSYFIFMNGEQQIELTGTRFENLSLILQEGWETPDYIYEYSSNISGNIFNNVTFEYIQKWNETNQEFIVYSNLSKQNSFDSINKGEGYFILSKGGVLVYVRTQ